MIADVVKSSFELSLGQSALVAQQHFDGDVVFAIATKLGPVILDQSVVF